MARIFRIAFLLFIAVSVMSCAAPTSKSPATFGVYELKMGKSTQKAENLMVILDASGSMNDSYKGKKKLSIEKDTINHFNQTIPAISLKSGIRTFGQPHPLFGNKTDLKYGITDYTKNGFDAGLQSITEAEGISNMQDAINAASDDIAPLPGRTALLIVSDGKVQGASPVIAAENIKKKYGDRICIHTIWIPSGTKDVQQVSREKDMMGQLANISGCGHAVSFEYFESGKDMADFVAQVLFEADSDGDGVPDRLDECPNTPQGVKVDSKGCPLDSDADGVTDDKDDCPNTPQGVGVDSRGCALDSDGDGVPDYKDQCRNTPTGVKVNDRGCPLDSDGDGVTDDKDDCPDTPRGTRVDSRGCPFVRVQPQAALDSDGDGVPDSADACPNTPGGVNVDARGCPFDKDADGVYDYQDECPGTPRGANVNTKGCWVLQGVTFDSGNADIKAQFRPALNDVYNVLRQNPELKVEIQGHTDNVGSLRYNTALSERRAKSVMDYLINQGINTNRMTYRGYGFRRPAAPNTTEQGRSMNRRVELQPIR